jgi:preprotein translocase subunit YajC
MSFFISDALAAAPAAQSPGMEGLLFPAGILVFFYFLFLRPQAQRAKEKKQMIAAMGKGVEVVTSGGILGKLLIWMIISLNWKSATISLSKCNAKALKP